MLATFVGLEVIRKVSPLLHTPLMSLTNAISAISVVGAILVISNDEATTMSKVLGFIAITAATTNIVSGFLITDRMLKMFKRRSEKSNGLPGQLHLHPLRRALILSLKWMNSPVTARRGIFCRRGWNAAWPSAAHSSGITSTGSGCWRRS
jgi:NAD(P) transhydrogenase subunit alpha